MFSEATLAEALTGRGYKLTQPRRAVLRVLAQTASSLSPAKIHARAKKLHRKTGLVTVYRTLDVLTECGVVRKVHQSDGCHSYAPASEGHAHHIVCEKCHTVAEFDVCDLGGLLKSVQRRTGFRVQQHVLELSGLCPGCRE
ncbi:MAG: transcriptional repressor, partial [Acidobacteria bacterium]|nr:transcriptional repressor [Acidobacteriota bacterium]